MKNKKSIAFTLSEVLMVLVIIGIIATMTIPSLVRSNEKIQYVVALKKFYATTNQALIKMAMDGGCIGDLSCFFDIKKPAGFTNANSGMGDKIVSYYKVAKNCKTADNQEC